jgi:hypothetical protein
MNNVDRARIRRLTGVVDQSRCAVSMYELRQRGGRGRAPPLSQAKGVVGIARASVVGRSCAEQKRCDGVR